MRDGPFTESKELIAGFWLISTKTRDEALEWARRVPLHEGDEIELRQAFEAADFAEAVPAEDIAKKSQRPDAGAAPSKE